MYTVTTPPRTARVRAWQRWLRQHWPASPERTLERQLASASTAEELDAMERRWAQTHRRRFG